MTPCRHVPACCGANIQRKATCGRIIGLPANPETARGFTGDVLLDEFAMHAFDREIWDVGPRFGRTQVIYQAVRRGGRSLGTSRKSIVFVPLRAT